MLESSNLLILLAGVLFLAWSNGANDNFKGVATLYGSGTTSFRGALIWATAATAAGSLLSVALAGVLAETMSRDITDLNTGQGLTANLVTAFLVLGASRLGVPVSTTHVSCGTIFGIGWTRRDARWGTISRILATWVTTLPLGALLGAVAYRLLGS